MASCTTNKELSQSVIAAGDNHQRAQNSQVTGGGIGERDHLHIAEISKVAKRSKHLRKSTTDQRRVD